MNKIYERIGKEKRQVYKLIFSSLFFLCLISQSQGQELAARPCLFPPTIKPVNAITCYGSSSFNFNYTSTGSPDLYTLTTGLRAMPGFSTVTDAKLIATPVTVSIPNSPAAGTYDFNIVVTNTKTGCDSKGAPFTLTIATPPTLTITAASLTVCSGSTIRLTAVPSNLVSYSWISNPVSSISSVYNPSVTVNKNTIYTVKATDANGCSASTSITITTKVNPAITSATATTGSLCPGSTTTLTANGVTGDGATVTWWTATGGKGTNLGTGLTLANKGPGTYFARVTGDCGPAVEASITVTSKVIPAISSATATAGSVCPGSTTTLTANGVEGTNAIVTWWTAAGGTGTNMGTVLT
jgi:hypothetical protein